MIGSNTLIQFGDTGEGLFAKTPEDVVKEQLKFLLQTSPGEIVTNPDYGTNLIQFVGIPVDPAMKNSIQSIVRMSVMTFMPFVQVLQVTEITSKDGRLGFRLEYGLTEGFIDSINVSVGE